MAFWSKQWHLKDILKLTDLYQSWIFEITKATKLNFSCISFPTNSFFIRSDWPDIATFNAMDVWQIACYLTVFASVAEFCLVIYLTKAASWEETLIKTKKVDTLNGKGEPKVIFISLIKSIKQFITQTSARYRYQYKDLFIKNWTRTVVKLLQFWFDCLWISLYSGL